MDFISFAILIFIAGLFASVLYYVFRRASPWGGFWGLLLFLFLVAWAARLWVAPAGPVFWGFGWLPIAFVVLIFVLLIAAISPKGSYRKPVTAEETVQTESGLKGVASVFSIFFWLTLVILLLAIMVGYIRLTEPYL
jgi:hypothetical protein